MFLDFFNPKIWSYFFELNPLQILEIFRPFFVRQIYLQKNCKKYGKKGKGFAKSKDFANQFGSNLREWIQA